jgi:glucokinase
MGKAQKEHRWLGLDIGGTKLLAAVLSDDLDMLGIAKCESLRDEGPEAVFGRVVGLCNDLIAKHGPVAGVGAGFAGLVDWRKGEVLSSIILPGWDGFPLAERLGSELEGLPAFADNDATAAGYGEFLALGAKPDMNMVLLTIGTGIGGAIIINGELYRGATGTSAEFGNTTIDWQGKECWCGNRGCLNMLASGSAISERAAALAVDDAGSRLKGLEEPIPVERIHEAAGAGDRVAARAIEEGARALGAGVANIINSFNPDRVVLTGGISALGPDYLELVREEASKRAFSESVDHAKIAFSVVGPEVGALGAAGLIRNHVRGR